MMTTKDTLTQGGTLEVSGRGEVQVAPDAASVRMTVISEGVTAEEAVERNAARIRRVVDAIFALGIGREDVQTVGLRLGPVYRYSEDAEPVIVGYRAENTVLVTSPIEDVGKVFDAGVAAGAGKSSGLTFTLRDEREVRDRALAAAVRAAEQDARVIAQAMGVELEGPIQVSAADAGAPGFLMSEARLTRQVAETPVLPGEITVSAQVRVIYRYQ